MSLKALLFLAAYAAGLGLAFVQPMFGLVTYLWAFYQYPENRWWGEEIPALRWSLVAGMVTLVALVMHSLGRPSPQTPAAVARDSGPSAWNAGSLILAVLSVWIWLQWPWALDEESHVAGAILFTKYTVFFVLAQKVLRDRRHLHWFLLANVVGATIWGVTMWQSDVGSARLELKLGPGVEDSNTQGLHLSVCAAFAGALFLGWSSPLRWLVMLCIPFILNGIVLTGSRGAFLGLIAAGAVFLLFGPKQRKGVLVACAVLGVLLFARLTRSETFWDRMGTIRTAEGEKLEGSAASRFVIARGNWEMFLDHPLGVGHRGDLVLSPQYMAVDVLDPEAGIRAAHNTALAVLTNFGLPGIVLFLALHLWAALVLWRLKRLDRLGLPPSLGMLRSAVASGLAAYVVCGLFSNYMKAEIAIWCFALVPLLDRECTAWLREHARHDTRLGGVSPSTGRPASSFAAQPAPNRRRVRPHQVG